MERAKVITLEEGRANMEVGIAKLARLLEENSNEPSFDSASYMHLYTYVVVLCNFSSFSFDNTCVWILINSRVVPQDYLQHVHTETS